jgi:Tfp pilus assembly protein PilP
MLMASSAVRAVEMAGSQAPTPKTTAPAPAPQAPGAATPPAPQVAPSATPPIPQAAPAPAPPKAESYSYNPEGRRDPFLNLIGTGTGESRSGLSRRGEGAAGMLVAEISVRGVVESRSGLVAMIQGPDNKTYIVHSGDKLLDGTIKSVTSRGLIVIQEVNDPLSLVKQREVSKLLRSLESGRQ